MSLHFDFQAFVSTLPVMLWGMLGGLVVLCFICLILMILYRLGSMKKKH